MRRVVMYARSSVGDVDLERQIQILQASLKAGDQVVASFTDRAPAALESRPGLREALDRAVHGGADTLLVQSLDRLARSAEELEVIQGMLRDRGVNLALATDSPEV